MIRSLLQKCRIYAGHEAGLAAVVVALMLPMLMASAGIAVDLSTAYNAKNRLASALDKATLAVGSSSGTAGQLQDRFMAFFNANYPAGKYGTPYDVSLSVTGSVMTGTASAHVPTTFMSIAGIKTVDISATSQVVRELAGVEAVLVLDVTGSMAGNNIAALKTASTNFLNVMFSMITDVQYIKIGIVPWSDAVNIGPYGLGKNPDGSNYGSAFVDRPATDSYVSPASSINYGTGTYDWGGCVIEPNAASITSDSYSGTNWKMYRYPAGSCSQYKCLQYSCSQYACLAYKCSQYNCTSYACAQYNCSLYKCTGKCQKSNGSQTNVPSNGICPSNYPTCTKFSTSQCATYGSTCIQQGTCQSYGTTCQQFSSTCQTYDTNNCIKQGSCQQYDNNTCVNWANEPNDNCPTVPILPLTNDQKALQKEIDSLPTQGNTYSDIGMVWGWRVISPDAPFSEASSYSDSKWSKTVILMTDGNNTINTVLSGEGVYNATGTSKTATDQNNKFAQTCKNMKAKGIRIYTITFQSAINSTTKQFYRDCATNTSMYYDAPSNQSLVDAFQTIAQQLSQLHLTK